MRVCLDTLTLHNSVLKQLFPSPISFLTLDFLLEFKTDRILLSLNRE